MSMFSIRREVHLKVMPSAAAKIKELAEKHGRPNAGLRIRVIAGGCAGLQYKLEFADAPAKDDSIVEANGVKVFIDPKSALFLTGSQLDYEDELLYHGFKISNPNAKGKCSCGESFTA